MYVCVYIYTNTAHISTIIGRSVGGMEGIQLSSLSQFVTTAILSFPGSGEAPLSAVSRQHLPNVRLQGTELAGFLQDESSTPDGMWGVCVGGKYLNTHGNVSVKETLKLWNQSLAREYWL